jgi:hypothetical protein
MVMIFFERQIRMAALSIFAEGAVVRDGTRPGDLLRLEETHFPGKMADFQSMLDYAVQQGWIEVSENGKDYRLTKDGFVAAQTAD